MQNPDEYLHPNRPCIHIDNMIYFCYAVAVAAIESDRESGVLAGAKFLEALRSVAQQLKPSDVFEETGLGELLDYSIDRVAEHIDGHLDAGSLFDLRDFLSDD